MVSVTICIVKDGFWLPLRSNYSAPTFSSSASFSHSKKRSHGTLQVQQRPRNLASPTIEKRKKIRLFGTGRNSQYALVRVLSAFKTTTMERCIYKNNSFHVHLWTTELHTTSSTITNRNPNIRLNTTTFLNTQLALNLRLRKLNIFLTQCWSSRVKTLRVLYLMLLWFTHTLKSRSERKPNTRLL